MQHSKSDNVDKMTFKTIKFKPKKVKGIKVE